MSFLPIVGRELRVAARRPVTAWVRFAAVLGAVALFGLLVRSAPAGASAQEIAAGLHLALALPLFGYCLLAGLFHTVDAIQSERRQGTLGLLFLTDLRAYDVVLGKLVATSLNGAYTVLALLPVLALPLLLGGVSAGQFVRTAAVLLTTLFLSLALGLFWSAAVRDLRRALVGALCTLGALAGAGALVAEFDDRFPGALPGWAWWPSPVATLLESFDAGARPSAGPVFVPALRFQLAAGAALLVATGALVRRYRDGERLRPHAALSPLDRALPALFGYRHRAWGRWLARNPYFWFQRVVRPLPGHFKLAFGALAGLGAALFLASLAYGSGGPPLLAGLGLLYALHQLLKVQLALSATQGASEDRHEGGLELLLVAGVGPEQIVRGHRDALFAQYAPALLTLVGLHVAALVRALFPGFGAGNFLTLLLVSAGALLLLWWDTLVLVRTGLREALRRADPLAAFRATYLRVMVPGWIATGLVLLSGGFLGGNNGLGLLTVLALGAAAWWTRKVDRRARIDLEHGFLHLAAGLPFDTDDWELRDDFRRAAMEQPH
jgi:hypothetical protein